jgi:hypothetical protein
VELRPDSEHNSHLVIGEMADSSKGSSPTKTWTPPGPQTKHHSSSSQKTPLVSDPPRPARLGYEWVWFPEGYWAEREFREVHDYKESESRDASESQSRLFKWRSRSSKSKSSGDSPRAAPISPRQPLYTPPSPSLAGFPIPPSPYLSEQAHVQSLQNPLRLKVSRESIDAGTPWSQIPSVSIPESRRSLVANISDPLPDATGSSQKGLFSSTRRGLAGSLWKRKAVR